MASCSFRRGSDFLLRHKFSYFWRTSCCKKAEGTGVNRLSPNLICVTGCRCFLTNAYKCEESWVKCFQDPLMQNVKTEELFFEINKKLSAKKKVSAVDIDVFAHRVKSPEELPELEHVLYGFRRTRSTVHTLDSTHYSVVRAFLEHGDLPSLLRVLSDRVGYGIFPDNYGYNMFLDKLLKEKNYRDATKVAIQMMLQEDFSNPIGAVLALYACHMYLQKPQPEPWEPETQEPPPPEDDEEVFIRIPFVRNPHFDDHFDIKKPLHLIGKTLYMVGKEHNDIVGRSYQFIGLGMYEKWEKCHEFMDRLMSRWTADGEQMTVLEEAIRRFQETVEKIADDDEKNNAIKDKLKAKIDEFFKSKCIESGSLDALIGKKLATIDQYEAADIEAQAALFETWLQQRKKLLDEDLFEIAKKEMKMLIETKKRELEKKEDELFFFENWDKHHLELAEIEMYEQTAKKTVTEDEIYIPPEVHKPRSA